ncbi:MAG: hypothetical protein ACNFW9_01635 [Candidatus Kerfeldbacteria bacterium]|jgi:hypothetical protein
MITDHVEWARKLTEEMTRELEELLARHGYRFIEREDLVPGRRFQMVEIWPFVPIENPRFVGTQVMIDDPGIRTCDHPDLPDEYVYYHSVGWKRQCFVPLEMFLNRQAGPHDNRQYAYVVPNFGGCM